MNKYSGSLLSNKFTAEKDVEHRNRAAYGHFEKLIKRAFNNKDSNLTTLQYGCETCTLYRRDIKKIRRLSSSKASNILEHQMGRLCDKQQSLERVTLSKHRIADHETPFSRVRRCSKNERVKAFKLASSLQEKTIGHLSLSLSLKIERPTQSNTEKQWT